MGFPGHLLPHFHGAGVRLGPFLVDLHPLLDIRKVAVELPQDVEVLLEIRREHLPGRGREAGRVGGWQGGRGMTRWRLFRATRKPGKGEKKARRRQRDRFKSHRYPNSIPTNRWA